MNNYTWVTVEKIISAVFAIASLLILPRYLSASDFGLIAIIMIFVNIATVIIDSGLGGAIIKNNSVKKEDYSTVFTYNILIAIFLYIIIWILAPSIAEFYKTSELTNLIRAVSTCFLITSLYMVDTLKLTKELNFKVQSIFNIISRFTALAISIILAVNNYGYWSITISLIISHLVLLFLYKISVPFFYGLGFSKKSFLAMIPFGLSLSLSGLIRNLYINILPTLIGRFFGLSAAGYFSQANKFNDLFLRNVISILDKTSFPILCKVEKEKFKTNSLSLYTNVMFLVTPILLLLSLTATDIINIALGKKWEASAWYLAILCYSGIGLCIESVSRNILKAKGLGKEILIGEVVKLTALLIISIPSSMFSLDLLFYNFIILTVFNFFYNIVLIRKKIGITVKEQITSLLKPITLSFSVFIIIKLLIHPISNPICNVLFITALFMLFYALGLYFLGVNISNFLRRKK
ncbi:lipopolysaccharide biosynthesis protein [Providencia rettgeri]|uniref:lipopolysaccharide biosynthesis protein n=1 Tax=Providencia rettgeri TaxID=587 RepID=UPI003524A3F7